MIDYKSFAKQIKDKYPGEYDEYDDLTLARAVVKKYPVYADKVTWTDEPRIFKEELPTSMFTKDENGLPKTSSEFATDEGNRPLSLRNTQQYAMELMPGEIESAKTKAAWESQPTVLQGIERGFAPFTSEAYSKGEQPGAMQTVGDIALGGLYAMPGSVGQLTGKTVLPILSTELARGTAAEGITSKMEDREFNPVNAAIAGVFGAAGEGGQTIAIKGLKSAIGKVNPYITEMIEVKGITSIDGLKSELKRLLPELLGSENVEITPELKIAIANETAKGIDMAVKSGNSISKARGEQLKNSINSVVDEIMEGRKTMNPRQMARLDKLSLTSNADREVLPFLSRGAPRAAMKQSGVGSTERGLYKAAEDVISNENIKLPGLSVGPFNVNPSYAKVAQPIGRYGAVYFPTLTGLMNKKEKE